MKRIIFSGAENLKRLDMSTVKVHVPCHMISPSWFEKVAEDNKIQCIDMYALMNYSPADCQEELKVLLAAVAEGEGDVVLHDQFGKYRARSLATVVAVVLGQPLYQTGSVEEPLVMHDQFDYSIITENLLLRIRRWAANGELVLPEVEKKKVFAQPHEPGYSSGDPMFYLSLATDTQHFIRGGFHSEAEMKDWCAVWGFELVPINDVPGIRDEVYVTIDSVLTCLYVVKQTFGNRPIKSDFQTITAAETWAKAEGFNVYSGKYAIKDCDKGEKTEVYVEFNAARDGFCIIKTSGDEFVKGRFTTVNDAARWAEEQGYFVYNGPNSLPRTTE